MYRNFDGHKMKNSNAKKKDTSYLDSWSEGTKTVKSSRQESLCFEFQDVPLLVDWFSVVACLSESSHRSKALIFCVIDDADESRAAGFGPWDEMDRHHTLYPVTTWELKHVVPSCIAACAGFDILFRNHAPDIDQRIYGRNHKQLIDVVLHIVHTSLEVVDGVLILEFEVAFIVVDSGYNVVSKFS
jgi:hypothetical protein